MTYTTTKMISLPLRMSIALYIISILFNLMHWPLQTELTLVSVFGLAMFYSFRFYNKIDKGLIDYIKLFLVLGWSLNAVNKVLHLISFSDFFGFLPYVILIWLLITRGISYTELFGELKLKKSEKVIYTFVFLIAVVSIFLGGLFKTMHWPYASIILIVGFVLFSSIIILDYFVREYPIDQNEIDEIGKH